MSEKRNLVKEGEFTFQENLPRVKIVKKFFERLGFEDILFVGSSALLACGFPLNRKPKDIDVEIICSEEEEKTFRALAEAYGNDFYKIVEDYPVTDGFSHKPYIFEIENIMVNVWCVKSYTHPHYVSYEGINFAPVCSILEKKFRYGREKDNLDGLSFIQTFLNLLK